jgi:hypothetical protein
MPVLRLLNVVIHEHIYIHKKGKVLQIPRHVVIFRPRNKQEYYILFGIFAGNTCLYSLSVFYISPEPISNTHVYLFFVLHHWASFTGVCHGFGLKTGIDET